MNVSGAINRKAAYRANGIVVIYLDEISTGIKIAKRKTHSLILFSQNTTLLYRVYLRSFSATGHFYRLTKFFFFYFPFYMDIINIHQS